MDVHCAQQLGRVPEMMAAEESSGAEPHEAAAPRAVATINKYEHGWRRIVRNFSPSWFAVTMGTGMVSVLLFSMPYQSAALYWASVCFFVLNVVLFSLAAAVSALRYGLYPEIWAVMVHDPKNSLFLGTIPMGFATLVQMLVFVVAPAWGPPWPTVAWVLWIVDTLAAVAVTVSLGVMLITATDPIDLREIHATQLLPIAAPIVAAAQASAERAAATLLASYVLWGMGVPLALCALAAYYQRLMVHKLPPREVVVSSFLPLGPLGFGGHGLLDLGAASRTAFVQARTLGAEASAAVADVLYGVGFLAALLMWAFGLVWQAYAVAAVANSGRRLPFNMGWWGFTFPLGVYAASTIQIGKELASPFFLVLGTVFACAVVALWLLVAAGTLRGAYSGALFHAPCLANLTQEMVDKGKVRPREGKEA